MATTKKAAAKQSKAATKSTPAPVRRVRRGSGQVIDTKLRVEINAKSDLRRVIFGLEKHVTGGKVQWKIQFELMERKSAAVAYGSPLVKLDLELVKELESAAEKITKAQKLTTNQAAHAIGPAADDAKSAKTGEITQEEANETVQDTVRQ